MSMSEPPMHVEFRRSGGIAGIDMTANVDTQQLPDEQAEVVAELAKPGSPPAAPANAGGPPDTFHYELTVHDGDHTRTHHWAANDVPDTVRPLLADLGRRAQPAPPR